MVNILLLTHGEFALGINQSLEMIIGEKADFICLDDDGISKFEKKVYDYLDEKTKSEEVLVLCDMRGGTPFNVSMKYSLQNSKVKVICGLNLPMLIAAKTTDETMDNLINIVLEAGKEGVENVEL